MRGSGEVAVHQGVLRVAVGRGTRIDQHVDEVDLHVAVASDSGDVGNIRRQHAATDVLDP